MSCANDTSVSIIPLNRSDAAACEAIGRALPGWFGIEEGLEELRHAAETQSGFAAVKDGTMIGFVTVISHFPESWEITWMAIHPDHHRCGIGRRLVEAVMGVCRETGASMLLVKTLADTHPSPEYAQTRAFYAAMGFARLQTFPDLWGTSNPCLLMAKVIG